MQIKEKDDQRALNKTETTNLDSIHEPEVRCAAAIPTSAESCFIFRAQYLVKSSFFYTTNNQLKTDEQEKKRGHAYGHFMQLA